MVQASRGLCRFFESLTRFCWFGRSKWHQMRESSLSAGSVSTLMSSHWSKSFLNMDRFLKVRLQSQAGIVCLLLLNFSGADGFLFLCLSFSQSWW